MTEDGCPTEVNAVKIDMTTTLEDHVDPIVKLRDEMQKQFATLKKSFENTIKQKDEQIAQLTKSKDALEAALVKSAMMPPTPEAAKPPSEEEIRQKQIADLAERTKQIMIGIK